MKKQLAILLTLAFLFYAVSILPSFFHLSQQVSVLSMLLSIATLFTIDYVYPGRKLI